MSSECAVEIRTGGGGAHAVKRMLRRVSLALWLGCGLSMLCAPASAEARNPWTRPGPYFTLAGVVATDLYEDEVEDAIADQVGPGVGIDIERTGGISARAGVRFLKVLALELHYEYLAEYDLDIDVVGLGRVGRVGIEHHTLTANARVNLPIGRIQPYVLAGIGFQQIESDARAVLGSVTIREKDDDTVVAGRVGAGLEVYLTEHVALFGEGLVVLSDQEIVIGEETVRPIFYGGGAAGLTYRF